LPAGDNPFALPAEDPQWHALMSFLTIASHFYVDAVIGNGHLDLMAAE
jgi:hypothetical protein